MTDPRSPHPPHGAQQQRAAPQQVHYVATQPARGTNGAAVAATSILVGLVGGTLLASTGLVIVGIGFLLVSVVVGVIVAIVVGKGQRTTRTLGMSAPRSSYPPPHGDQLQWAAPQPVQPALSSPRGESAPPTRYLVPALLFVAGVALVVLRYLGVASNVPILLGAALVLASLVTGIILTTTSGPTTNGPAVPAGYLAPGTNGFAVASLVLGLVGVSLLAVIFGHVARSQIKRTAQAGKGMATAGLILGYIGMAAGIAIVLAVAAAASRSGY